MSKLALILPNRRRVPQSESPKSDSLLEAPVNARLAWICVHALDFALYCERNDFPSPTLAAN